MVFKYTQYVRPRFPKLNVDGQQKGKHLYGPQESFPASFFFNYAPMKQLSLIVMIMITIMIMIMITIMIVIIIILLGSLKFFIHIVKKSTPRFTKSPSLVLIRLVLTEIK